MKYLLPLLLLVACGNGPPVPQHCRVTIPGVGNIGRGNGGTFEYCYRRKGPQFITIEPGVMEATQFMAAALRLELFEPLRAGVSFEPDLRDVW